MKGKCSQCGGWLQFKRSEAHHVAKCPYCGRHTELVNAEVSSAQRRRPILCLLAIGVLVGLGLGGLCDLGFDFEKMKSLLTPDAFRKVPEVVLGYLMIFGSIYFLPSLISLEKRNRGAIFILDLFFGWTIIGWLAALAWALVEDERRQHGTSGKTH